MRMSAVNVKMTNEVLVIKYKKELINIRKIAKEELNLADNVIDKLFHDCISSLGKDSRDITNNYEKTKCNIKNLLLSFLKYIFIFVLFIIVIFIVLHNHQPTFSLVLRNVQYFIYPGLKLLRILAIPIIQLFPNLSELYDETCLVENPYFQVANMECWPCENVNSVLNSTKSFNPYSYQTGIPYMLKTLKTPVDLRTIQDLYRNHSSIFNEDAKKLSSTSDYNAIEDILIFNETDSKDTHISWRINRMSPARKLRTLFSRPRIISPWSGQSTERYLFIDEAKAEPYVFPNSECSYILLTQGAGERMIILKPSKECSGHCRIVSTILKPKYSLLYNWWYWRPISLPSENSTEISITYLTSYC